MLALWLLAISTWEAPTNQVHVAISSYRPAAAGDADTLEATPVSLLVVYVYAATSDPACPDNLRYFIRTAVKENDGAHYVFAVQMVSVHNVYTASSTLPQEPGEHLNTNALPRLPRNARYVPHRNACYDWYVLHMCTLY